MNSESKDKSISYANMDVGTDSHGEGPSNPYKIGHLADRLKQIIGKEPVRAFAQRADVSEGTVRNLLSGGVPKLDSLINIAEAGGVTVEWLSTGVGPQHYEVNEPKLPYINDLKQNIKVPADQKSRKEAIESILKQTHDPDQAWAALIIELMYDHGLTESGVQRILETLAMIKTICK